MIDWELITALIFYIVVGAIIYKNRKKLEVMDKVFFVFKNKEWIKYIKKIARPEWFWKIVSTLSIPLCLFFMIFSIHSLALNAANIINSPNPTPGVSLLIPGVTTNPLTGARFPLFQTLFTIIIIAVVHEASHGIIAIVEKIKLKTTGIGMFLVFPLAFVEPDKKSFLSADKLARIRMLCAGSFANLITALLAFLLVINVINPIIESEIDYTNALITNTIQGEPASLAGVPDNVTIISLNNQTVNNITEFHKILLSIQPNTNITLKTSNGTYTIATISNPGNESMAYLGVIVEQEWEYKQSYSDIPQFILSIPLFLANFLMLVANLNFAVGVFNLFPLWITDGGKIMIDLLSTIFKKEKTLAIIVNLIFYSALSLLFFNMIGPYFI